MLSIRYFLLHVLSVLLLSCGGSSSDSSRSNDIYSIDSYKPIDAFSGSLTGTWLVIVDFDMEYSDGGFHEEFEFRRFHNKTRFLISIHQFEDHIYAYRPERSSSIIRSWLTNYANGDFFMLLDRGAIQVEIENNKRGVGRVIPKPEDYKYHPDSYEIIHSSHVGMVKLSNRTIISDSISELSSWGNYFGMVDRCPGIESEGEVHFFEQQEYTWAIWEHNIETGRAVVEQVTALSVDSPFGYPISTSKFQISKVIEDNTERERAGTFLETAFGDSQVYKCDDFGVEIEPIEEVSLPGGYSTVFLQEMGSELVDVFLEADLSPR